MTLVNDALATLTAWTAPTTAQEQLRCDFIEHLTAHSDGWSRSCLPDHLTASAIVLDHDREHVLLALHRKVRLWLQFGGHIEASDASLLGAAQRETVEESGLRQVEFMTEGPVQLDRHAAPCRRGARHHLDVQFRGFADRSNVPMSSIESLDVSWFPLTALPRDTDDAVRALVRSATQ
jgi:8-oxo-dGTP pyrophosphatase MutT (NUDIX family)